MSAPSPNITALDMTQMRRGASGGKDDDFKLTAEEAKRLEEKMKDPEFMKLWVEYAQSLGTAGDIVLWSPSSYQLIDKASGIQSAASIHVAFTTAEQAFRFLYRVDGAPLWHSALTPKNGSNTQSTMVALSASS